MRAVAAALALAVCARPAWAQYSNPPGASSADLAALQNAIPTAATTIPPAATQTGAPGSGLQYTPANAAPPNGTRSTDATTAADGTVSVTWSTPLTSSLPKVNITPINTGAQPIVCNVMTRSAATVTGKCWQLATTVLSLSIITAGLTLSPSGPAAAGIPVMIVAREPSP